MITQNFKLGILGSEKNSPVGPLIIPAPFPRQGQGSVQDQEKSIAKGRRSSMDKTSTLFLRKSNMSDTMSGYNGSRQGSARGIESPIHSDRSISDKNITVMSGRNSKVQLIPQGPAFIGVVPVSDSRQHTKTNFSNIEREDEEQNLPKNLKQQASIKSFKNNKSLRSNKYSTDNLNKTSPIQSHKVLPSIKSSKRLSPVQSPKQNQKLSLKAKSIIDSSSGLINNGSLEPSVAADSSTALVKQIAQSSARQGIQSEQQGNNYIPPVPIQTSADEEDRNGSTKKSENQESPRRDQTQQLNKGYDTPDQKIVSDVQQQQAKGQQALLNNQSFDNQQQNNTSAEFPGVLAFPRGAGQGASKSPRNYSLKKSIKSNSKSNNSKALSKSQSKKQLNNSQSSQKIGNKNLKSNTKKTAQRPSPRHLFDPDAMTVPIIQNQNSKNQKLSHEIEHLDQLQNSHDYIKELGKGPELISPSVAHDKKESKLKNKPPNLNKSYVSDAPQYSQQNNDSPTPQNIKQQQGEQDELAFKKVIKENFDNNEDDASPNSAHKVQNNGLTESKIIVNANQNGGQILPPLAQASQLPNYAYKSSDPQIKPKFQNGKQDLLDDFLITEDPVLNPCKLKRQMTPPSYIANQEIKLQQQHSRYNNTGSKLYVVNVQGSTKSQKENPDMQISPGQFVDQNKWRQHRILKPQSKSQQINQRRIGGGIGGEGVAPLAYPTTQQYQSPSLQLPNGGITPLVYPGGRFIPFSARPEQGASSVSPVIQKAGALSLYHFNGLHRKQGQLAAGVVGGFEPIERLKSSASPMAEQLQYTSNTNGRNAAQNGKLQGHFIILNILGQLFYPNRSLDEQLQSNDPLSSRNQAIPLNPGLAQLQSNGYPSPHYNFGFQPSFDTNLNYIQQVGREGRKPVRYQVPKTGQDFLKNKKNYKDLMDYAYHNPTQFQKQVLLGYKPNQIFHPPVDMQINQEEAKYEILRSDKKKEKKKPKANLRDQSDKAISVAPPGGMRNLLSKKLIGLQNAYLQKPKKTKSKTNLKTLESQKLLLNNQLGTHISPPHGQPPMSRMSPIPPNHNNYAFSPRK